MPQEPPLLGRAEGRAAGELDGAPDVVEQRRREQQVGAEPRMELGDLAADRRHADGVLQQAARIAVMPFDRRRQRAQLRSQLVVLHEAPDSGLQAGMRDLAREELEKAVQLVRVAAHGLSERGRVEVLRRLERAHLELQAIPEAVDPPEHPDGVALGKAAVQEVDVGPDPRFDPSTRVDELQRKVRGAAPRPQPLLLRDRVDALDDPVVLELRDRRHAPSLGSETDATVRCRGRDQAVSRAPLRH